MTNPTGTQWENALLNKLTSNGERIAVVEKEVKDIKETTKNIDRRLNGIDERLNGVDERLKGVDKRLNGVDERLNQIEQLLGWLKIIGMGVVAIALSLIANFVYSFVS